MIVAKQIEDVPFNNNSVVSVGTFDGVHLAHKNIIEKVVTFARKRNGRSVIVTFDPHPREVVEKGNREIKLLTTLQERQELCEQWDVELFIIMSFDIEYSRLSFRDFYVKYIIGKIGVNVVVEGYDHHWGRNREGNMNSLILLGAEFGFDVVTVEPFLYDGLPVNSSIIRNELNNGMIEHAAELLGKPYSLQGIVVLGDQRGYLLGYPTANLALDSNKKVIPKDGIYLAQVYIGVEKFFGMVSIGVRPTFKTDGKRIIEVNILDFNRDIYGSKLRIDLLRRLRDELKFNSADQLVEQMHQDEILSRKLLYEYQSIQKN